MYLLVKFQRWLHEQHTNTAKILRNLVCKPHGQAGVHSRCGGGEWTRTHAWINCCQGTASASCVEIRFYLRQEDSF